MQFHYSEDDLDADGRQYEENDYFSEDYDASFGYSERYVEEDDTHYRNSDDNAEAGDVGSKVREYVDEEQELRSEEKDSFDDDRVGLDKSKHIAALK